MYKGSGGVCLYVCSDNVAPGVCSKVESKNPYNGLWNLVRHSPLLPGCPPSSCLSCASCSPFLPCFSFSPFPPCLTSGVFWCISVFFSISAGIGGEGGEGDI